LISCNFKVSSADHSLFTKNDEKNITIILVYVDDLIIIKNNEQGINQIKQQLRNNFNIKDLGYLKYFFGIEIAFSKKVYLFLKQNIFWIY
jgi:Reverse transcriptase (RNA-dependent DNA polymerase)